MCSGYIIKYFSFLFVFFYYSENQDCLCVYYGLWVSFLFIIFIEIIYQLSYSSRDLFVFEDFMNWLMVFDFLLEEVEVYGRKRYFNYFYFLL